MQIDAELRYYMHINPDELTDDEWAIQAESLKWIREKEAAKNKPARK